MEADFGQNLIKCTHERKADLHNITTNLTLGYTWKKKRIIYDLRINQPLTIYSSSNIEHTKSGFEMNFSPMPEFSPILPFLSINIGYRFNENE